jgi:hypothetical protein
LAKPEIFFEARMARAGSAAYLWRTQRGKGSKDMAEDDKPHGLTRSRIFLLVFFGIAIVLAVTTILGTWDEQKNGVIDPATMNDISAQPAPAK